MVKHLHEMVFESSKGDQNVWMRPGLKDDGEEYYEYVLMYVYDILSVSVRPRNIMA